MNKQIEFCPVCEKEHEVELRGDYYYCHRANKTYQTGEMLDVSLKKARKQIDEMAKVLYENRPYKDLWEEDAIEIAKVLYNAGYRKQSEGEWIYEYTGEALDGTDAPLDYKCSLCGELSTDAFNYCPNCGARMRGGKE